MVRRIGGSYALRRSGLSIVIRATCVSRIAFELRPVVFASLTGCSDHRRLVSG